MLPIEELVIKVKAVRDLVQAALTPLEAAEAKIRTWLMSMNKPEANVDGLVKTYLQVSLASSEEVVDTAVVASEFEDLIKKGKYTAAELRGLFMSGVIGVIDEAALAGAIALKIPGYTAPLKVVITPAGDPAKSGLRINVLAKARFEGIRGSIGAVYSFENVTEKILASNLPTPVLPPGQVAVSSKKK